MVEQPKISPKKERAWRDFRRAQALVDRYLDEDLRAHQGISMQIYDALVQLSEAPDQRLRMNELASALTYSASGITRLVDTLERHDYARREPDAASRRSIFIRLTAAGLDKLQSTWLTHVSGVQEAFARHLTDTEAATFSKVFQKIISHRE